MNYEIGKIIKPHGLKGELIIKPSTDFDRFKKEKELFTLFPEKKTLKIKQVRPHKNDLLIIFYDYEDINKAELLKGLTLYTDETPALLEDEYHYNMLVGKEVYNQHQEKRGTVIEVVLVPQGHLLRIDTGTNTKLIPFNKHFIKEVTHSIIIINEIEGLL